MTNTTEDQPRNHPTGRTRFNFKTQAPADVDLQAIADDTFSFSQGPATIAWRRAQDAAYSHSDHALSLATGAMVEAVSRLVPDADRLELRFDDESNVDFVGVLDADGQEIELDNEIEELLSNQISELGNDFGTWDDADNHLYRSDPTADADAFYLDVVPPEPTAHSDADIKTLDIEIAALQAARSEAAVAALIETAQWLEPSARTLHISADYMNVVQMNGESDTMVWHRKLEEYTRNVSKLDDYARMILPNSPSLLPAPADSKFDYVIVMA